MRAKKGEGCLSRLFVALIGLLCALALGAIFYATMVYQFAGSPSQEKEPVEEMRAVWLSGGTLVSERESEAEFGGERCRVVTREYALASGETALAISATPAAYIERLSQEGWTPELITGFSLAGLDAVYERNGERALLAAREGNTIYLIEAEAGEEEIYALGVGAELVSSDEGVFE